MEIHVIRKGEKKTQMNKGHLGPQQTSEQLSELNYRLSGLTQSTVMIIYIYKENLII